MSARTPVLVLLILFLSATAVLAQGGIEETVKEIAEGLNCPLCQGLTLYDCPLTICEQMRGVIRDKLEAGESREAIVQHFVEQYGEEVLNAPPKSGFNLAAWILPFVGLVLGGAFLSVVVASWLRPRSSHLRQEAPAPPEGRDPYFDRVERDLEDLQ